MISAVFVDRPRLAMVISIVITLAGTDIRLSVSGPNSRVPGAIIVAEAGGYGGRWFGRVTRDGQFQRIDGIEAEAIVEQRGVGVDVVGGDVLEM